MVGVLTEHPGSHEVVYRCPACARPLRVRPESQLCNACGAVVRTEDGILLLTPVTGNKGERAFYDEVYATTESSRRPSDPRFLGRDWESLYYPMNADVLRRVADVRGKTILLLGNGASEKELFFLTQKPRTLIVSDLSLEGLRSVRRLHQLDETRYPLEWAVMDATSLPVLDRTIDIVYGYAFVHHLPDTASFLTEVARVLRPGGRCIFMDNRYSPAWQRAKLGALRPLMRYFHEREGPSPADLRATLSGWHREEDLHDMITSIGGKPFFDRSSLFHYLFTRASERLPPRALFSYLSSRAWFLRALIRLDMTLSRFERIRDNQIRLVWGFEMPVDAPADEGLVAIHRPEDSRS
jgi:ubiquinone/menaquinone biosynthesis C-methylase UbiE